MTPLSFAMLIKSNKFKDVLNGNIKLQTFRVTILLILVAHVRHVTPGVCSIGFLLKMCETEESNDNCYHGRKLNNFVV